MRHIYTVWDGYNEQRADAHGERILTSRRAAEALARQIERTGTPTLVRRDGRLLVTYGMQVAGQAIRYDAE